MKEIYDPVEESKNCPRRSNYQEYRNLRHPPEKKNGISRGNKIFLIDLAMIAIFGAMIFFFRPYLISPHRIGDFTFSAKATATEDNWIQLIISAHSVKEPAPPLPPVFELEIFYEGIQWKIDNFLEDSIQTEKGFQWILKPFPLSQTEKISILIRKDDKQTDWVLDIENPFDSSL